MKLAGVAALISPHGLGVRRVADRLLWRKRRGSLSVLGVVISISISSPFVTHILPASVVPVLARHLPAEPKAVGKTPKCVKKLT